MKGADGIFAIGDCTATSYAPTAQVAAQEGAYLARVFKQLARHDALKAELEEARRAPLAVPAAEGETAESEAERAKRLAKLEAQVAKTEESACSMVRSCCLRRRVCSGLQMCAR